MLVVVVAVVDAVVGVDAFADAFDKARNTAADRTRRGLVDVYCSVEEHI